MSAPYNNTQTSNTSYDHFNVVQPGLNLGIGAAPQGSVGAKITNFYSQLDNIRLQDITLVCGFANEDDYRENKKFMRSVESLYSHELEGSAIQNVFTYDNNFFHYDRFYEEDPFKCYDSTNYDRGLSLVVERKYDLLATMAGSTAFQWYTVMLVQKYLHIGAQMIQYQ